MNIGQPIFTLQEAAQLLKVCVKTLRRVIDHGMLKTFKVGRQWRIRASAIDEYQQRLEDDFVSANLKSRSGAGKKRCIRSASVTSVGRANWLSATRFVFKSAMRRRMLKSATIWMKVWFSRASLLKRFGLYYCAVACSTAASTPSASKWCGGTKKCRSGR